MSSPARHPGYLVDAWMGGAPFGEYAYLLGMYLGDGYISQQPRTERLRITLDKAYPGIIEECRAAVAALLPQNVVAVVQRIGCVDVSCYSKRWSDLLPQHGPGPKHLRPIRLEPWQRCIVAAEPRRFLRGLFHSDGSYVLNRVRSRKGRLYVYDRYFFCNHSDDIKQLFCWACRLIGVETRPDGPWQISVARRASVAKLNEFLGPKA
jgi:hypothetical protein